MGKTFGKFAADSTLVTSVVPAYWGHLHRTEPPTLVFLHCTAGGEGPQSAAGNAAYAAAGCPDAHGKLRPASFHYVRDGGHLIQCVPEMSVAFGAAKGNTLGIHVEMCGRAEQTAAQWDDPTSRLIRTGAVALLRDICKRRSIPTVLLRAKDLTAGRRKGITTHAEWSKAFPSTGHWDPGPNFPLVDFMIRVAAR